MLDRSKVIIAGAGGIGRAVGLILADSPGIDAEIYIGDMDKSVAQNIAQWIREGSSTVCPVEGFEIDRSTLSNEMDYVFHSGDILLDCLPGDQAPRMASYALKYNMHYVNLTEYVRETEEIMQMAAQSNKAFVLQSGLAPGYINILAHKLYKDFTRDFQDISVDAIKMRVGALTRHVEAPHYYAFTWSPVGVATEYNNDAYVLRNGRITTVPALSGTTSRIIDGISYEEDYTSGGAADLPQFFEGKVSSLDYKTIRYPGHYNWVREQLAQCNQEHKTMELLERMLQSVPFLDEDLIVIYASVTGRDRNGQLRQYEKAQSISPMTVGSHRLKAIQVTTAAPMLEAARIVLKSGYQGIVLQSRLDPDDFLSGPFIQQVFRQNSKSHKVDA
ncbi:MAG: saccharopine dehydrogenase NADP-binding domain-containing protein [Saprospiraceae bacterium]|nr:saccharopine dehydrogenase NADP-binding domain-containing protein [Saprospiraceae bacterium]MBX7176754.1 saccharopine dehydrogenase NADP-binding domain-containing protein [Saprospiraceae bacterium]HMW39925.1 saccharopine dehydrogenase C-terminal domain-containing protein [Saprospiraceae bacterium]HMX87829.1 saccharopine dehydrogenase C-terminal domain-containing protein [Saprospiraceae bacterium]HMZ39405.1 saccharopine dehydrogenase C-terminal domain-containing protein [Saprospiraceae bacter